MQFLALRFRLVGYSINYFIMGCLIMVVTAILEEHLQLSFVLYMVILLLFSRILWLSDRFATRREYVGSAVSWNLLPLQIVIASVFYALGSLTIVALHPIESFWMSALYTLGATALNVILDLLGLRRLEEQID